MSEKMLTEPCQAKIVKIKDEAPETKTFTIKYVDEALQKALHFTPGKFFMLSIFGYGEIPISISSSPLKTDSVELTIVDVGNATHALHPMKEGDIVGLRGPFGNGFPIQKFRNKDIVFVSGGCGMAPLRPAVKAIVGKRSEYKKLTLFYGCKRSDQMLFKEDLKEWSGVENFNTLFTVDEGTPDWKGEVGVVTKLFGKADLKPENSIAMIVGPPVMIHFAIIELKKIGFKEGQIYASLERLMHCGMGKCAHCNVAGTYVCTDGPVFSGAELAKLPLEEK